MKTLEEIKDVILQVAREMTFELGKIILIGTEGIVV